MSKLEKSGNFRPFRPWKMTFRAIQEGSCQNREKVTDQFLRKLSKVQKGHKFGPFDL